MPQILSIMGKKIFISHASADKEIVSEFVDNILVSGCGVGLDDIFYTSREDTGVTNGDDIPSAIKDGILESKLFFMMISDNYRKSEVCLNEMGAAWAVKDIDKCILLLPNVGFDRIGWLMSLNKGTKITDDEGLDSIRDLISDRLDVQMKTSTWNRSKSTFLSNIKSADVPAIVDQDVLEIEDNLDFLTIRERFDEYMGAYTDVLNGMTSSVTQYSEKVTTGTNKLNKYVENPKSISPGQVRGVFTYLAKETEALALSFEEKTPLLRKHFDLSIKYGIMLQKNELARGSKDTNRQQMKELIESMVKSKSQTEIFRKSLDDIPDMDKTYTNANNRLKKVLDNLLNVISFCVGRANEFNIA